MLEYNIRAARRLQQDVSAVSKQLVEDVRYDLQYFGITWWGVWSVMWTIIGCIAWFALPLLLIALYALMNPGV